MKKKNGFTLIEVIVAIALLAVISIMLWQAMGSTARSKEGQEDRTESYQSSSIVIKRMIQDLEMSVLYRSLDILGVSGNREQVMKSVFIGKNEGDQDKLTFNSFSHLRYLKNVKESDLAEISYFLDADPEHAGLYTLKKREQSPPDDNPDEGGQTVTLIDRVKELNFRYYHLQKGEYVDAWDSTSVDFAFKLPRSVEIILVIQDPVDEEAEIRVLSSVILEMAPGPNDF